MGREQGNPIMTPLATGPIRIKDYTRLGPITHGRRVNDCVWAWLAIQNETGRNPPYTLPYAQKIPYAGKAYPGVDGEKTRGVPRRKSYMRRATDNPKDPYG